MVVNHITLVGSCGCTSPDKMAPTISKDKLQVTCKACGEKIRLGYIAQSNLAVRCRILVLGKTDFDIQWLKEDTPEDSRFNDLVAKYRKNYNELLQARIELEKITLDGKELERLRNERMNLESQISTLKTQIEEALQNNQVLQGKLSKTASELKDIRGQNSANIGKVSELQAELSVKSDNIRLMGESLDAVQAEIMKLKDENTNLQNAAEIESKRYASDIAGLKDMIKAAEQTVEDVRLESSKYISDLGKAKKVKVREFTENVLRYVSAIYNKALDAKNLDDLSEMVLARTEQLLMSTGSSGITMYHHERGSGIGEGRIDIVDKTTDNPELGGTVSKSRQFGCSFANEDLSEIPEKIEVWKYVAPEPAAVVADSPVTVAEVVVTSSDPAAESVMEPQIPAEPENVVTVSPLGSESETKMETEEKSEIVGNQTVKGDAPERTDVPVAHTDGTRSNPCEGTHDNTPLPGESPKDAADASRPTTTAPMPDDADRHL